ncbi:MAG: hypothetical protein AB1567_04545 [bacterium]
MNNKGEPENNFFRVSHKVFDDEKFKQLNNSAKVLYFTLCKLRNRFADENGVFFRSDRTLVKDSGLGLSSIWRARHELLQNNFIKWKQGKSHIACLYQINDLN